MSANSIGLEQLSQYFHLPINSVAKELGVCATVLKKICRRNGIPRWPHRKIKSLDKMIATLEASQPKTLEDQDRIAHEVANLKSKKRFLVQNPNVLVKTKKKTGNLPRRRKARSEAPGEKDATTTMAPTQEQKGLSRTKLVKLADTPSTPLAAALLIAFRTRSSNTALSTPTLRIPNPCWPPAPSLSATLLLHKQGGLMSNEFSPIGSAVVLPDLQSTAPRQSLYDPPLPLEPSDFERQNKPPWLDTDVSSSNKLI